MTPEMEFRISGRNRTQQAFDQVRADMRKTGDALSPMGQKIDAVTSKLGMLPGLLKASLVGVGIEVARQFAGAVGEANNAVAALYDQAKASNVSFEGFQALGYAAKQNRIEIDSLGQGLREMQDKAEEFATTGGGRGAEAFERLGYNAETLREALKDPIELFEDIIEKMGDLDRAAQIRLMGDIFGGGEGDQFLKLLDDGKAGLEQLQQTARDTGRVLGEDLGAAAVETRRKFDEWASAFDLWWKGIAVSVAEMATGGATPTWRDELAFEQDTYADYSQAGMTQNGPGEGVTRQEFEQFMGVKLTTPADPMAGMYGRGGSGRTVPPKLAEPFYTPGGAGGGGGGGSLKSATKEVEAFDLGIQKTTQHVDELALSLSTSLTDGVMSIWQAWRSGENVLDAVANKLMSVADQLMGNAIQGFFQQVLGGGFGGGFLGTGGGPATLTNVGRFDTGGWTGGRAGQPAGIVHGEEFVVKAGPAAANRSALEAMNAGLPVGGGGGGALLVTAVVEVRNGNLVPTMVKVSGEVAGQKIKTDAVPALIEYQRNGGR